MVEPDPVNAEAQMDARESRVAALDEALAAFGVDAGQPTRRRERALELDADGLDVAGLVLIGNDVEMQVGRDGNARRVLAWNLNEPSRWQPYVADLRRYAYCREERNTAAGSGERLAPGEWIRRQNMERIEAAQAADPEHLRQVLARRIMGLFTDGKSLADIALDLGVPLGEVQAVVAEFAPKDAPKVPGLRRKPKEPKEPSP